MSIDETLCLQMEKCTESWRVCLFSSSNFLLLHCFAFPSWSHATGENIVFCYYLYVHISFPQLEEEASGNMCASFRESARVLAANGWDVP